MHSERALNHAFYEVDRECECGEVTSASQFIVYASISGVSMYEMVRVGVDQLLGEVIRLDGNTAIIRVFESTSGLQVGDPVVRTKKALSVELGPGLLDQMFDSLQRPFKGMSNGGTKIYVPRGANILPLDRQKLWEFIPQNFKVGDHISGGDIFGKVYETALVLHWIMLPPKAQGTIVYIAPSGHYSITEKVLTIEFMDSRHSFTMMHEWPVRYPRPYGREKLSCNFPLFTGQRVLDYLFPIAQGGTCAIPGAFGTGKGVLCQNIAKYSNSDVVVYVSCGERGNELAEILTTFPETTIDLKGTLHSVLKRTCIVGNTSNMTMGAREAAILSGVTIAEYFRDQGYNSTMIADSTTPWMEEIHVSSYRIPQMPASSGYPAYFAARLASFYERAGKVECKGSPGRNGALSIVATVSPPGGDFADRVTAATLSICQAFWALDKRMAQKRNFPAVKWAISHSRYAREVTSYFGGFDLDYSDSLQKLKELLQTDNDLEEIVALVGQDSLTESDKLVLVMADLVREYFLEQNAFTTYDKVSPFYKTAWMMKNFMCFYELARRAIERNVSTRALLASMDPVLQALKKMKTQDPAQGQEVVEQYMKEVYAKIFASFCKFHEM